MQIGFNNDIQYRDKTFHIQTEDRGLPAAQIETQIFHAGAILDTAIIPYQKIIDSTPEGDDRIAKIRHLMATAHKNFYKKLHSGDYDTMVGLQPVGEKPAEVELEDFTPSQERIPTSAMELEDNPEAFAIQEPEGEAVDLSKLHEHLAAKVGDAEPSEVEEPDAPTMMVRPEDLNQSVSVDTRRPAPVPTTLPSWSPTGAKAWRGCVPSKEDVSILEMIEAFVG